MKSTGSRVGTVLWCAIAVALAAEVCFADFLGRQVVVANRGGASISVIEVDNNNVTTIPMPAGANTPEPMYFWHNPANDLLFVGDRANNRVVAFDPRTYGVVNANIPAGVGVFHMWGNPINNQLWVVNDTGKTLTVFDMTSFAPLGTVPTPADLGPNAVPHDIVMDPDGSATYISMVNTASATNDAVIKYTTAAGFAEVDRANVGKAPHLGVTAFNNVLYVPNGNTDTMDVLSRSTLDTAAPSLVIDNAHGVAPTEDGQTLYVTTFPGTGVSGLHVVNTTTHTLINSVTAPNGPHNVVTSSDDARLYIAHSGGASTLVSAFDISGANRNSPVFLENLTSGLNPFGILAVPAIPEPACGLLLAALPLLARRRS